MAAYRASSEPSCHIWCTAVVETDSHSMNFFLAVPDSRRRGFPPISLLPPSSCFVPCDESQTPQQLSGTPTRLHFREIPLVGLHFFRETPLDFVRLQSTLPGNPLVRSSFLPGNPLGLCSPSIIGHASYLFD